MANEQEYYQQLASSRNKRLKDLYRGGQLQAKKNASLSASQRRASMKSQLALARRMSAKKKTKKKKSDFIEAAKNLPLAFTAVNFSEDTMQFVVIMVSILADLFTLMPVVGNFFAIVFSVIIWILYAISGHLRRNPKRKIVITGISQGLETLGLGINMLPFFTASALINYWLILADRKAQSEAEKNV